MLFPVPVQSILALLSLKLVGTRWGRHHFQFTWDFSIASAVVYIVVLIISGLYYMPLGGGVFYLEFSSPTLPHCIVGLYPPHTAGYVGLHPYSLHAQPCHTALMVIYSALLMTGRRCLLGTHMDCCESLPRAFIHIHLKDFDRAGTLCLWTSLIIFFELVFGSWTSGFRPSAIYHW